MGIFVSKVLQLKMNLVQGLLKHTFTTVLNKCVNHYSLYFNSILLVMPLRTLYAELIFDSWGVFMSTVRIYVLPHIY